ncbi:MAG: glycosyltransferase [Chlorobi bacterium CHB2]|nr:glycosyltransferase [Chlorobi bacterium CHB2]
MTVPEMAAEGGRPRLIVFAKYPKAGGVKTRLSPPLLPDAAADLYRAFLLDAINAYRGLPAPIEVVIYLGAEADIPAMEALLAAAGFHGLAVRPQRGAGLGERLESALQEAFNEGIARACVVGTDHPTLPLRFLLEGFASLRDAPAVVGPATDGGYYLIGMSRLIPELLRGMPYSTNQLLRQTLRVARLHHISVAQLPPWYDVDDAASLAQLVADRGLLLDDSHTARWLLAHPIPPAPAAPDF